MINKTKVKRRNLFVLITRVIFLLLLTASIVIAQDANAIFKQGSKLFENGKYDEAIAAFQKYANLKPDDAVVNLNIGEAYYNLNQFDKAIEYYRKAIAMDADYKDAWESLGDVLFNNQKKWSEAADAYEHIIKLDPKADNYYTLGSAYFNNEQYEKAAAAYRKSLELNPKDKDTRQSLADAEAQIKNNNGNPQATITTTTTAQSTQTDILFNQGLDYFNSGDYKKAIKPWEQALKLGSNAPELFYNLGLAYYNNHQYSKSVAAFQQVLQLDANFPNAQQNLIVSEAAKKAEKDKQKAALWAGIVNAVTAVADNNKQTNSENQSEQFPRLGKYHVLTYGVATSPPIRLGYFDLLSGGKYNFYDNGGNFVGGGNYIFDAANNTVEWSSGVFKDNGWGGAFNIEREGKTHIIRLKSNTIGTNSTDSN